MQQAFIALVKAVEYYNCELEETNFLTILKYCIWNEIRDLTSELPVHMQNKIFQYKRTYDQLYNELGYKPKAYQIMLEMNISQKELETIKAAARPPISLDAPVSEEGTTTRLDLYADSRADEDIDFDNNVEKQDLRKIIDEALNRLPGQDMSVIEKHYFKNATLKQIGEELQVSPERVRQLKAQGLRKLRKDTKFTKKVIDYTSINDYKHVGVDRFNNTWTSSTEWVVLERERRFEEWLKKSVERSK